MHTRDSGYIAHQTAHGLNKEKLMKYLAHGLNDVIPGVLVTNVI